MQALFEAEGVGGTAGVVMGGGGGVGVKGGGGQPLQREVVGPDSVDPGPGGGREGVYTFRRGVFCGGRFVGCTC